MTIKQFKERFGRQRSEVQEELYNWGRNIELGNRSEVMLTEISFGLTECGSKKDKWLLGHRVSGYVIESVTITKSSIHYIPKAIFSPLLSGFIADYYFSDLEVPFNYCRVKHSLDSGGFSRLGDWFISKGKYDWTGISTPIDDDDTRTLVLGNALSYDCGLGRRILFDESYSEQEQQPMLDMVRTINQHPESRSRMLNLYDKLGAPNNLLGAALRHMDKFRTF